MHLTQNQGLRKQQAKKGSKIPLRTSFCSLKTLSPTIGLFFMPSYAKQERAVRVTRGSSNPLRCCSIRPFASKKFSGSGSCNGMLTEHYDVVNLPSRRKPTSENSTMEGQWNGFCIGWAIDKCFPLLHRQWKLRLPAMRIIRELDPRSLHLTDQDLEDIGSKLHSTDRDFHF